MIKKLLRNAVAQNAIWLIMGRVAQTVISLIVGLMTARYLGPSNYGLLQYVAGYTALFMSLCTLGINSVLVNELVENPDEEGEILGSSLLLRGIASLLSSGIIILIVSIVDANEKTTLCIAALSCLGLVFQSFEIFRYWFQSKLRSKVTAMATLVAYILTSVLKLILLICGSKVEWFAFATAFDHIVFAVLLFIYYFRDGGQKLTASMTVARRILKQSYHFILAGLMVSIYGQTDKLMLKHMLSEEIVGYYATAVSISGMWGFVIMAIIDSMHPSIIEAKKNGRDAFDRKNILLYAIVFYVSILGSIAICIFAEWIVLIMYGEQYRGAINPLRMITFYTAFSYLGVARNIWVVSEEKQNYLKYSYFVAMVCNVILNYVMIPRCGATGAAAASLVTQIVVTLIFPLSIRELKENVRLMVKGILLPFCHRVERAAAEEKEKCE